MSTLTVAGIQPDIAWEEPEANLRRAEEAVARAAGDGARLVVLPEMFATGFSMKARAMASHADAIAAWVSEAARRHGVWVLAGLAVPGDARPRNEARLVDPEGDLRAAYHKVHPFTLAREHEHFEGGSAVYTVDVEGVRVTPLVCYDLRFPELFRAAAHQTDLFVVIANWPEARRAHWRALLQARAIENQAYVLGVNRVGEGDRLRYVGDSVLHDPLGEPVSTAAAQPGRVQGVVDAAQVGDVRARFSFLADRRPAVYAGL
jgi:predicted amidohydrolase